MTIIIITAVILGLVLIRVLNTRRALAILNENVNNAMSQIGVQLSSRFHVLAVLLELTRDYDDHESRSLMETVNSRRCLITAASVPDDVRKQESLLYEVLGRISGIAEQYPELKAHGHYCKCMKAMDSYEKMMRTCQLIYNDSVTKLNRTVCMFPTSQIAGMLGFQQRDYVEIIESGADLPDLK